MYLQLIQQVQRNQFGSLSVPTVASVDRDGMVVAHAAGQTTIKVTSSNGKVARCIVTVKDVGQIIPIKSVTLDYESANLEVDETLELTAILLIRKIPQNLKH